MCYTYQGNRPTEWKDGQEQEPIRTLGRDNIEAAINETQRDRKAKHPEKEQQVLTYTVGPPYLQTENI